MRALASATREALTHAGVRGDQVAALALDTTGSSVIPVGEGLAAARRLLSLVRSPRLAGSRRDHGSGSRSARLEAIDWCGGTYSSEWGFSKLLHWLRNNPDKRDRLATAFEHCDMVAAVLCGITDPAKVPRSICAMGHKWMWNESLGGLPPEDFLTKVDPAARRQCARNCRGAMRRPTRSRAISRRVGREARFEGRHSDSCRRVRCALGRDRRRCAAWAMWSTSSARPPASSAISERARPDPGRLRRCARIRSSELHGHRSRAFRSWRYLRRHRHAAPARRRRVSRRDSRIIARAKPACCG